MAPNFQSSFIPKGPVTDKVFQPKKTGFLGVLSIIIFISVLVLTAGLYLYKGIVQSEINDLKVQLVESEKSIDKKTINDMYKFSKKLDTAKSIITNHRVVSNVIKEIASSTVSTVFFNDFVFESVTKDSLKISMKGFTGSYANIALQENVLIKNPNFKNVVFSNLVLTSKGPISFEVTLEVVPSLGVYAPIILNKSNNNQSTTTGKTSTTTKATDNIDDLVDLLDTSDLDANMNIDNI